MDWLKTLSFFYDNSSRKQVKQDFSISLDKEYV